MQVAKSSGTQRIAIRSKWLRNFRFDDGDLLWAGINGSLQGDKDPGLSLIQAPLVLGA